MSPSVSDSLRLFACSGAFHSAETRKEPVRYSLFRGMVLVVISRRLPSSGEREGAGFVVELGGKADAGRLPGLF